VQAGGDDRAERQVRVEVRAPARSTKRSPWPWRTTRSAHVRLSRPQAIVVGANDPSTKRL
jgi:hypothetical protein